MDDRLEDPATSTKGQSAGLIYGTGAYLLWGLFPLFFWLLRDTPPLEILAHRVLWSAIGMTVVLLITRPGQRLRELLKNSTARNYLLLAAVVITVNWGMYIYAVTTDRVVEASLGYFINPLVTVLLGILVLGESLRRAQWLAMAIATVAVGIMTVDYGHPPWIALTLAFSFACYGYAKKKADMGAVVSLTFETLSIAPLAIIYLQFLTPGAKNSFFDQGIQHALLLVSTGVVTAVPLLLFGAAATRLSLTSLGILQYLGPVIQFVIGVWVLQEQMSALRWVGFALIWIALVIFTFEAIRQHRRTLLDAAESAAL